MLKLTLNDALGEYISQIVFGVDLQYLYPIFTSKEMIFYINVLCTIMKHIIFGETYSTQTIIKDIYLINAQTKVTKQPLQLNTFLSCFNHCHILSLDGGE
jgi:hypothetical protein